MALHRVYPNSNRGVYNNSVILVKLGVVIMQPARYQAQRRHSPWSPFLTGVYELQDLKHCGTLPKLGDTCKVKLAAPRRASHT